MSNDGSAAHSKAYLDANRGPVVIGIVITVTSMSTLTVIARLFTRQKISKTFHLDDLFTVVACVFEWLAVAFAIVAFKNGSGKHIDTLSASQRENALFYTIISFPFSIMAFGLPKLAVAALLTVLLNPGFKQRIVLWTLPTLCLLSLVACTAVLFAQCSPVTSQWDLSITDRSCWSPWVLVHLTYFATALSAFTDLYLAAYPATVLWKLQMGIRKKAALSGALGVGLVATIVAVYKCTRLAELAAEDFTYETSDLVIWTVVESSTIIIACCVPVLHPLLDLIFGHRTLETPSPSTRNFSRRTPVVHDGDSDDYEYSAGHVADSEAGIREADNRQNSEGSSQGHA